jgi:hypothetical protein
MYKLTVYLMTEKGEEKIEEKMFQRKIYCWLFLLVFYSFMSEYGTWHEYYYFLHEIKKYDVTLAAKATTDLQTVDPAHEI